MIVNEETALARLNSPNNLIVRLRETKKNSAMSLFGLRPDDNGKISKIDVKTESKEVEAVLTSFNPFKTTAAPEIQKEPQPILDNILEDNDTKIKLGLAHDNALKLLNSSVDMLATKLDDIKADKLPSVVTAASKVVESIRKERNENAKNGKDKEVHYHFYTPVQKTIADFNVIDVTEASTPA